MSCIYLLTGIVFISLVCFIAVIFINKYDAYKKTTPSYTFLFVKNNEECVEGVLRLLASGLTKQKLAKTEIIVFDMNSNDQTALIVKHLCKEYSFIHLIENDNCD